MWESGGREGKFCYSVLASPPPSLPPGSSFYSFIILFLSCWPNGSVQKAIEMESLGTGTHCIRNDEHDISV